MDLKPHIRRARSALTGLALAFALAAPAMAADAAYPPGYRIGLVPAAGLAPARAGFENADKKTAILIMELPGTAYADMEKTMTADNLKAQGLVVEKREDFPLQSGKSVLVSGRQDVGGVKQRKWILLASISDVTAVLVAQAPEDEKDSYSDSDIRAALASLTARPAPLQEQLGMLPFKFSDLAGFRVMKVTSAVSAILTDGQSDDLNVIEQPHVVVAAASGPPIEPGERENFARQNLAVLSPFKDMHVTFSEPVKISGQQGYEIRVDAKDAATQADVSIVQWTRFGAGGYLHIVAISPKDKWAMFFPRFRAIRDGIN